MEIMQQRVNRITKLRDVDSRCGIEFDVRSRTGKLILAHEPHRNGDTLKDYLRALLRQHASRRAIDKEGCRD